MLPGSMAPLIDRLMSVPLQFVGARHAEQDTAKKPEGCVVLTSSAHRGKRSREDDNGVAPGAKASKSEASSSPKRPKTMAEAVAAYTGRKFRSRKPDLVDSEDDEDMGEDLGEAVGAETEEKSASESPEVDGEASATDESDADFTSTDSPSSSTVSSEEEPEKEEDEGEEAKEEEKEEEKAKAEKSEKGSQVSPVSPVSQSSQVSPKSSQASAEASSSHYSFNELAADRGDNGSRRIYKSWREIKGKPAGLINHGVTCYMNTAIQALIHVPAVQHYLNEVASSKAANIKPGSVTKVLADLSRKMWGFDKGKNSKPPKYVDPKQIIRRLDDINCMMSEWQQEDSHEYYMSLLSRLQEDSTPKGQKLNTSIIYDIFGGLLRQKVTCKKCNHVSETKQEFYDLSLGIKKRSADSDKQSSATSTESSSDDQTQDSGAKKAANSQKRRYSIDSSVEEFFSNEVIRADKKDAGYMCEKCKQLTNAHKISTIERAPETLTVHLKRFKFDGNSSSKVKKSITYNKYLDLTDYTTDHTSTVYQLISVIVHEGRSISSGHYIAHCLQPDGSWATYDDEYINKINEKEAMSDDSAYVLVYNKLTTRK
ncbi:Ubiquitin carboxyl-terminal hydrolase 10 [Meyerozyma sp. JA9]|nr:Ubiquitin carboxyl-terminal hydrolase 10 [Meyerozyma sp. JA9]